MTTLPHAALVSQARKEIRSLRRPREVRRDAWDNVIDLLAAIAGYLPDCWPSERTLAAKLGRPQKSIDRTLQRARALGLVTTTLRPIEGGSRDGQSYHLLCLSEGLRTTIARRHFQTSNDVRSTHSYSVGVSEDPSSDGSSLPAAGRLLKIIPGGLDVSMNESRKWQRENASDLHGDHVIGSDPKERYEGTQWDSDPAPQLARRWDAKWVAAKRRSPALAVTRGSLRNMVIGYVRTVMLRDNGLSPEHIEAYMDAFIEAAAAGDVIVKEGQQAFERFTAWWGREDVEDPAERLAAKQSAADAVARAREIMAQQAAQRDADSIG